jgi:hypothetical protein
MRLLVARHTVVLSGATVLLGVLAACSTGGSPSSAATTTSKAAKPTAAATYDPMAGPIEAAAQLPKSCSKILQDTDLTAAFGSPQVGDTSYGSYAPLPNIGRTGRVTCGFVIGIDQFGRPGPAGVTVSVITYNTAANAVHRVASNVNDTVAKGATAQPVLVNGHPATILVEPATPPPPAVSPPVPSGTAASATATPGGQPPSSPAQPAPSASATASGGNTELVMADGNRTFVITIPMSKVSGSAAATTLVNIMALVYQHTLPPTAPPTPTAPSSASASTPTSASPAASPKPSAT